MILEFTFFYIVFACMWMSVAGSEVMCCKVTFNNHSAAYKLTQISGPNCSTKWILKRRVIVNENGETDNSTIKYFEPMKVILKRDEPNVFYNVECPHSGVSLTLNCTDPCLPENDENRAGLSHWTIFAIIIAICLSIFIVMTCVCRKRRCCDCTVV